jgi:outer membrane protein assembly factor BamD
MKNKSIRWIKWAIGGCCLIGFLAGCAGPRESGKTPQSLYDSAMQLYNKKKYEKAAEAFRKLKEEFPLSSVTPLAELRTADAVFHNESYAEAIPMYEEFKKLHPIHPEVPYATYQVGMCYFKQILSIDRDQTATEKAIEQFRYLIENFPRSSYVADARKKLTVCQHRLAERELYVGRFYYRAGKYKAALGRFQGILKNYPDAGLDATLKKYIADCQEEIQKSEKKSKN